MVMCSSGVPASARAMTSLSTMCTSASEDDADRTRSPIGTVMASGSCGSSRLIVHARRRLHGVSELIGLLHPRSFR